MWRAASGRQRLWKCHGPSPQFRRVGCGAGPLQRVSCEVGPGAVDAVIIDDILMMQFDLGPQDPHLT
jgi:hypothetical protein